jgi:uncharacterized DUF497 family protein
MNFNWDNKKNALNVKKHKISFKEAAQIFDDPLHISLLDKRFDYFDERWITMGMTQKGNVIVVGHLYYLTEDGEEGIRIITARKATRKERKDYEKIGY